MQSCKETPVKTRVEEWRCIPPENQHCRYFRQITLLSTWFRGSQFSASNNQNYNLKDLKNKTICDEVCIETVKDNESNVNVSVSYVTPKTPVPH